MDMIKDIKEILTVFFQTNEYGEYTQISSDTFQLAAEVIAKHVKEKG